METHRDDHGGRQALRFASSPRQHRSDRISPCLKKLLPVLAADGGSRPVLCFLPILVSPCSIAVLAGFISNFYSHSGESWDSVPVGVRY